MPAINANLRITIFHLWCSNQVHLMLMHLARQATVLLQPKREERAFGIRDKMVPS